MKEVVIEMSNEEKSFQKANINWLILFYSTPLTNPYKIRKKSKVDLACLY